MKKAITIAALLVVSAILPAAVMNAAGARDGGSIPVPPPVKVSALQKPFHPTRRQRRQLAKLRRQVAGAPYASIASTASVTSARPVPLPDGLDDAWVSAASGGAICTFIP